ncbi:cell wall-binding repeat-containing protein [Marinilactibacillus psychrotolerans]|uniref:cell wall-binding repeat-containing protein n=1 Tax=Marinilactibacillus psychrotolerans TaxID=191770 RepID=UPI00388AC20E
MKFLKVKKVSISTMLILSSTLLLVVNLENDERYLTFAAESKESENIHKQVENGEDLETTTQDINIDNKADLTQETEISDEKSLELLFEENNKVNYNIENLFQEFMNSYFDLSSSEIKENINTFQLYLDDDDTIKSMIQSLNDMIIKASISESLESEIQKLEVENSLIINNLVSTSSSLTETNVERISGQNRFRVAENISKRGWVSSNTVLIANGNKFTDALSGVPLASYYNAPILLVNDTEIEDLTLNEITRLGAKNIIILGGPDSVPESISQILKSKNLNVRRIAGETRYDTSSKIAEELISLQGPSTAHLVNGEAFADAVSISTIAGRYKQPILLTKSDELNQEVLKIANVVKDWRIIGGTSSVSENVESQLKENVQRATRIAGQNRYEVNKNVLNNWGIQGEKVYLGSGEAFADVLTGSVLAAQENTGVLLINNNDINIESAQTFSKQKNLGDFIILGGTETLPNQITDAFDQLYRNEDSRFHTNGIYTVKRGDTFYKIAQSFNITSYQLSLWNKHITDENLLKVGDKLAVTKQGVENQLDPLEKEKLTSSNNPSQFESVYDFINWMGPIAIQVSAESGKEALYPSLMIAQAIHESGVARTIGESQLARPPYHNLFGIKAKSGQDYTKSWTWEYFNGERVEVLANFRRFPSYKESLQVYGELLRSGRGTGEDFYYRGTWRSNTKDVWEVLDNGGLRGYATDPAYFSSVRKVIIDYNLTSFDN